MKRNTLAGIVAMLFASAIAAHAKKKGDDGDEAAQAKSRKKSGEPLRKITVKTVTGGVTDELFAQLVASPKDPIPMMKVWGIATRMKPGSSDYGTYVKFNGQFRAVNIADGAIFRSSTMLLPKFLEDDLAGIIGVGAADGKTPQVEFGFELSVKYDKTSATKYVYMAENIVEAQDTDQLMKLDSLVLGKALPAPKEE
jgi:hypothetical protein